MNWDERFFRSINRISTAVVETIRDEHDRPNVLLGAYAAHVVDGAAYVRPAAFE